MGKGNSKYSTKEDSLENSSYSFDKKSRIIMSKDSSTEIMNTAEYLRKVGGQVGRRLKEGTLHLRHQDLRIPEHSEEEKAALSSHEALFGTNSPVNSNFNSFSASEYTSESSKKIPIIVENSKSRLIVKDDSALLAKIDEDLENGFVHENISSRILLKHKDFLSKTLKGRVIRVSDVLFSGYKSSIQKDCQDSILVDYILVKDRLYLVLGIFDGHGKEGRNISQLVASRLPAVLQKELQKNTETAAIVRACKVIQKEIALLYGKTSKANFSGTTINFSLLFGNQMITTNVGDSSAWLRSSLSESEFATKALNRPHNFNEESEKKRVIRMSKGKAVIRRARSRGGREDGPLRVFHGKRKSMSPGLAMSRSLGDTAAHKLGVSSTPELHRMTLTADDNMVIIGSDGVFDVMSMNEISAHYDALTSGVGLGDTVEDFLDKVCGLVRS